MFNFILSNLIIVLIYSLVTLNKNLIMGYIGYLHLAGIAFMAVGAYSFTILTLKGASFFPALLAGGILASIAGIILGLPTLRLKSHYIGIASLGFLLIIHSLIINLTDLTRGPLGIPGIPRPKFFGFVFNDNLSFLILTLIISLIIGGTIYKIVKSPFGKILETIRENDIAAKSLGKNTFKYKMQTYIISAFFTGIAGGLYASYINFIGPSDFYINQTILIVAAVMLGGAGSFWGSYVGTAIIWIIYILPKFLPISANFVGPIKWITYAILLILIMIFRPRGILGRKIKVFER